MGDVSGGWAALEVLATVAGVEGVALDLDLRVEGVGGCGRIALGWGVGFLGVSPRSEKDGLAWLAAIGEFDGVIGIGDAAACGGVGFLLG